MSSLFIPPLPLASANVFSTNSVSRRPPTLKRRPASRFVPISAATTQNHGKTIAQVQNELDIEQQHHHHNQHNQNHHDQKWRRHNAQLVTEFERNGTDGAVRLLWQLCKDGLAVTQNFNQVVSLLASNGRFDDGLQLAIDAAKRGLANIITFRPLMKRCCSKGDGKGAKKVWKAMTQFDINGDMFLYAELMGALVRSQDLVSAQKVVDSLNQNGKRPHIVLYNTLLKGYAKRANVRKGFQILNTIEQIGVRPDETVSLSYSSSLFHRLLNLCLYSCLTFLFCFLV